MVTGVNRPKLGSGIYKPIQVFKKQQQDVSSGSLKMANAVDTLSSAILDVAHKEGVKKAKEIGKNAFFSVPNDGFAIDQREFLDDENTIENPNKGKPIAFSSNFVPQNGGQIARDSYEALIYEKYFRLSEDELNNANAKFYNKVGKNGYTIAQYKTDISNYANSMVKHALPQFQTPILNASSELIATNVIKLQQEQLAKNILNTNNSRTKKIENEIEIYEQIVAKFGINSTEALEQKEKLRSYREDNSQYVEHYKNYPQIRDDHNKRIIAAEANGGLQKLYNNVSNYLKNVDLKERKNFLKAFDGVLQQLRISNDTDNLSIKNFNEKTGGIFKNDIEKIASLGNPNDRQSTISSITQGVNNQIQVDILNNAQDLEDRKNTFFDLNLKLTNQVSSLKNQIINGETNHTDKNIESTIKNFDEILKIAKETFPPGSPNLQNIINQKKQFFQLIADSFVEGETVLFNNIFTSLAATDDDFDNISSVFTELINNFESSKNREEAQTVFNNFKEDDSNNLILKKIYEKGGAAFNNIDDIGTSLINLKFGDYLGQNGLPSLDKNEIDIPGTFRKFQSNMVGIFGGAFDNLAENRRRQNAKAYTQMNNYIIGQAANKTKEILTNKNQTFQNAIQEFNKYTEESKASIRQNVNKNNQIINKELEIQRLEDELATENLKTIVEILGAADDNETFGTLDFVRNFKAYIDNPGVNTLETLIDGTIKEKPNLAAFFEYVKEDLYKTENSVFLNKVQNIYDDRMRMFEKTKQDIKIDNTDKLVTNFSVQDVADALNSRYFKQQFDLPTFDKQIGNFSVPDGINPKLIRAILLSNESRSYPTVVEAFKNFTGNFPGSEEEFETLKDNVRTIFSIAAGLDYSNEKIIEKFIGSTNNKESKKLKDLIQTMLILDSTGEKGLLKAVRTSINQNDSYADFVSFDKNRTEAQVNQDMKELIMPIIGNALGEGGEVSGGYVDKVYENYLPIWLGLGRFHKTLTDRAERNDEPDPGSLEKFYEQKIPGFIKSNFKLKDENEVTPEFTNRIFGGLNSSFPDEKTKNNFLLFVSNDINSFNKPEAQIRIGDSDKFKSLGKINFMLQSEYNDKFAQISSKDVILQNEFKKKNIPILFMPTGFNTFTIMYEDENKILQPLILEDENNVPTFMEYSANEYIDLPDMKKYNEIQQLFIDNVSDEQFEEDCRLVAQGKNPSVQFLEPTPYGSKNNKLLNVFQNYKEAPALKKYIEMCKQFNKNKINKETKDMSLIQYIHHLSGINRLKKQEQENKVPIIGMGIAQ